MKTALGTGSGTTKFLREDGTWQTPAYIADTNQKVKAGSVTFGNNDVVNVVAGSNVSVVGNATDKTITISATDTTYSEASTSAAGLMSAEDKTKLNGIESGAQAHIAPTTAEVKSALGTGSGTSKYLREDGSWATPTDNDTKNTAGTTNNASKKMYIVGAESQAANPQTYSNANCYIGTDNCLYSGGSKVLTSHQDISGKADKSATVSTVSYDTTNKKLTKTINGTTTDIVTASTIVTDGGGLKSHQTIKQDGITGATANRYATCSVAASTAAKTANVANGTPTLEAGLHVFVKFTYANTAASPTLNINSTGAKAIWYDGEVIGSDASANVKGLLSGLCEFVYDGTQWHIVGKTAALTADEITALWNAA